MIRKDWKVFRIQARYLINGHGESTGTRDKFYPYRVHGVMDDGEQFTWSVPNLTDSRYDLSEAIDETGEVIHSEVRS